MKVFMVSKSNKDANFANCFANNFRNLQLAPCNCISLIISIYSVLVSDDNTSKNSDRCLITPTFTFKIDKYSIFIYQNTIVITYLV